jgi:predicted aldo/keto reductase-like oxidoreductase
MKYRPLGRTGLQVSEIGLGTEHLTRTVQNMDEVLDVAVEGGLNYVDLLFADPTDIDASWWDAFTPALAGRRDKLTLCAHWHDSNRYDLAQTRACFEEVLRRIPGAYAELAMMTMIDTDAMWQGPVQTWIDELQTFKARGHVGHVALASHNPDIAFKAIRSGRIDVLMFNHNVVSHDDPVHAALFNECAKRGVGVVIMKAYRGGTLLRLEGKPTGITPVQCLSYVLSRPVSTVVPGARTAADLREALAYCTATEEARDFRPVIANLYQHLTGLCVSCDHCLPCPEDIHIGEVLGMAEWAKGGITDDLRQWYAGLAAKPSDCIECGDCTARCPFDVDVPARMAETAAMFA